ncbi:diaminopimelate decarboxylase [Solirubrobacter sp. CPCC 204708]|uniref:Diaminopimelate decarboxylase n=1 Tax=Solirubrobacter deserti TaxID=2282478 RepID=A0ABT4RT63_9ACTN|nr:diaminopimelate decarboxylase [Solirubrobacter deserti]MBE2318443.1 diaminopimelate decarboxylase [Solirubrobacter deserti]MDA0141783.1 diaminopimelate decarboxylase [Solirubrobacter deserti]
MPTTASHLYPQASAVDDGRLTIGGCDAAELAREFGTPLYAIAEDDLRGRAREFRAAMGDGEVIFASKAFPCTAVLRVFEEEGLSVDVASGGELALARKAGFQGDRILLHGNAKSARELEAAADVGARIVVDNFDDIDKLDALGKPAGVLIRVTPGVVADTHAAILTGHAGSKFGFSLAQAPRAIERLQNAAWADLHGLHMHIGSQLFDLEPWRLAVEAIATLGDFPAYDLGGGLAVAYTPDRRPPSVAEYVSAMIASATELLGEGKRLSIEPGRSLTASSGVTLYTVESVKDVDLPDGNVRFVGVDGGMSDNLRPMLYDAPYQADLVDRVGATGTPCTVVGKHCESGDVLIREIALHEPKPGDVLVTPVTGAYVYAMANNYNGVPRPPVVFCKDGDARLVVRRETFEDLHGRDV